MTPFEDHCKGPMAYEVLLAVLKITYLLHGDLLIAAALLANCNLNVLKILSHCWAQTAD